MSCPTTAGPSPVADDQPLVRLREFLGAQRVRPETRDKAARLAWSRQWHAALEDAGLAGPAWPRSEGGLELDLRDQVAYHQELARAKAPSHPSPMSFILAPTLIKHGTADQRARFLRPLLRADELWCQGFSEPEAGSDLPSLRTKAVRVGDEYLVTGQKVWTSQAEQSDWMFALVRTGPQSSRSDGISFLLIRMDSPGISVRPLRDITGGTKFSEVFLDEVRVPVEQRVGQENEGWKIARTSLGHERTTMSMSSDYRYRRIVEELFDLARQRGQLDDPLTRQRLGHALIGVRVLTANAARTLGAVLSGVDPGPEASANRVFRAEFEQHLHETALGLLGPAALLDGSDPTAVQGGRWTYGYLATRASTIGAGTAEIQRNTIAEKVLGLPAS